jgi:hypothetical protein
MNSIFDDIAAERERQDKTWGQQNLPVTYQRYSDDLVERFKSDCDQAFKDGALTWDHIMSEKLVEALAETDPAKRRVELVQLAAVVVACIESEDRKFRAARPAKDPRQGELDLE